MRNLTLSLVIPTGLVSLSLVGCGQENPGEVARKNVALMTDQLADVSVSPATLDEADRVYTKNDTEGGVEVLADYSSAAFEQDRLNAMIPDLASSAAGADVDPQQKYSVARAIATIQRKDADYLAGRAADRFTPIRARLISNLASLQQLMLLDQQVLNLQANREQIIETLQTGEMGTGVDLQNYVTLIRRAQSVDLQDPNDPNLDSLWARDIRISPVVDLAQYDDAIQYPSVAGLQARQDKLQQIAQTLEQIDEIDRSDLTAEEKNARKLPLLTALQASDLRIQEMAYAIEKANEIYAVQLTAHLDQVETLLSESTKNRRISQELAEQASKLTGPSRFEKLDQAARVEYQALGEQARAETLIILARHQFSRLGLTLDALVDEHVLDAIYNALNDAGNVPAAADPVTFRSRLPEALVAFSQAPANLQGRATTTYLTKLAQTTGVPQADLSADEQRKFFSDQVIEGERFARQFLVIQRGTDSAGTLDAIRSLLAAGQPARDLVGLNAVIELIEARITEVRADQARASNELQQTQTRRNELAENFLSTMVELDDHVKVLVMQRYESALESVARAEATLTAAAATPSLQTAHDVDLLSTYLQHVRIQHNYLMALEAYDTLIQSYIAKEAGNVAENQVLTDTALAKLQQFSAQVGERIAELRVEASTSGESTRNTVQAHLDKTRAAATSGSPEADQVQFIEDSLGNLWRSMSGLSTPIPAEGDIE
ncbi:MAG: hypothetical protein AAGH88_06615 [Planctomycetota bacterium]